MEFFSINEIFDRYVAMQDRHEEILENNITALKEGLGGIADLDYLTVQRDMIYKEVKEYFDAFSTRGVMENQVFESGLKDIVQRIDFIMERENSLRGLVEKNAELIAARLAKLRKGKTALGAYQKSSNT